MLFDNTQLYGVGLGVALASRKIGRLPRIVGELQRMITAGCNPRFLTIVPVERCGHCKGRGVFENGLVESDCEQCFGFQFRVKDPANSLGLRRHNYDAIEELKK